jgi:hypothetical protein
MAERKTPTYKEIGRRSFVRNLTTNGTIISSEEQSLWRAAQRLSASKGNPVFVFPAENQVDTTGKPLNPDHSLRIMIRPSSEDGKEPTSNISLYIDDLNEVRARRNYLRKAGRSTYDANIKTLISINKPFSDLIIEDILEEIIK